jgi:pimeloyl-ACP methyl ester carboxylesterase
MSTSPALGEPRTVEIPAGTIEYRETGSGPPIVFIHGVGVNGDLWRKVTPDLAADYRCIVPDLPFGAHSMPLRDDADLSLAGMAQMVADFIEALDLHDSGVVGNDTGGAVAQWLVGHHPARIGWLVLTSCDAFEKFPPTPQRYLEVAARSRVLMWLVAWTARFKFVQRWPTAYGWVTQKPIDEAVMRSFTAPVRTNPGIRRDLARLLRAVDTRYTYEAAGSLLNFDKPALVLWAADDKIFPRAHGKLLAQLLPQGRFELVAGSRTFISEDQPERFVAAVREFIRATAVEATPPTREGNESLV